MMELIVVAAYWVLGCAVIYGGAAFCLWDINPAEWPMMARCLCVLLSFCWGAVCAQALADLEEVA